MPCCTAALTYIHTIYITHKKPWWMNYTKHWLSRLDKHKYMWVRDRECWFANITRRFIPMSVTQFQFHQMLADNYFSYINGNTVGTFHWLQMFCDWMIIFNRYLTQYKRIIVLYWIDLLFLLCMHFVVWFLQMGYLVPIYSLHVYT